MRAGVLHHWLSSNLQRAAMAWCVSMGWIEPQMSASSCHLLPSLGPSEAETMNLGLAMRSLIAIRLATLLSCEVFVHIPSSEA